ncbi:hypothetical protein GCM10008107_12960 [Psychrosphaera saromensis]|nr:hypothetical protein GCM10008107_12960 [Psychrosphaera saromensis]GLQ14752.1 hypothetical protein GCM10007917_22070 [Psychrosphaera saromensis]
MSTEYSNLTYLSIMENGGNNIWLTVFYNENKKHNKNKCYWSLTADFSFSVIIIAR